MVLPLRPWLVVLQSPCWAGSSLRSTISLLMQTCTAMAPPAPPPMRTPCLAIISSIILRCSGGRLAMAFWASAMALLISALPLILLLISHKPGLRF